MGSNYLVNARNSKNLIKLGLLKFLNLQSSTILLTIKDKTLTVSHWFSNLVPIYIGTVGFENLQGLYYRLKQVDSDGVFSFSPQVELTIDVPFMGYPVPFDNELNIRYFPYRFDNPQIRIVSSLGQEMFRADIMDTSGIQYVNTESWPSGIYFIHLKSNRPNQVFKVIKE